MNNNKNIINRKTTEMYSRTIKIRLTKIIYNKNKEKAFLIISNKIKMTFNKKIFLMILLNNKIKTLLISTKPPIPIIKKPKPNLINT